MKPNYRKIAIIGGILLILLASAILAVCIPTSNSEEPTYPTIENATTLYENATAVLSGTDNISLQISYKKETLLGNEFLTEQSVQNITYNGLHSDSLQANVTETLIVGNHTVDLSEIFSENQLYLTVDDCRFRGDMDMQTYLSRYTPVQPLTSTLYNTITGEDTGDGYTLFFSGPTELEPWVLIDGATLQQSSGSANINTDGQLTKSNYSASYTVDNIHIRLSVTVEIDYSDTSPIKLPDNVDAYIKLASPDAPKMLEKACGYLLDATDVQSTCKDTVFCEAFGDRRNQTVILKTAHDTAWSSQVDTTVEIINSSKSGASTNYSQREVFKGNTYSISVDGAPESVNKDIDINTMRNYCQDLLVGTILLPEYITSAIVTEAEDIYTIEFIGNDVFAHLIDAEACTTLYNDANILSSTAQSYAVEAMRCYLSIDKDTGLPVGSGFDYQGVYTIDQFPYQLQFQSEQKYTLRNKEAGG